MGYFKKILTFMTVAALALLPLTAAAEGVVYGTYPPDDIYVTQSRAHTCTLVAATMMLRNYSCTLGSPYIQVTDSGVEHYAWTKEYGLSHEFTIGSVSVSCSADIHNSRDKKAYLINALREPPEGVVIYDTGAPHAIFLIRYDEDLDTFFVADTINRIGNQTITLMESIIQGNSQQDKVNTIDKIWYVNTERQ